jgi:hypothetical protein
VIFTKFCVGNPPEGFNFYSSLSFGDGHTKLPKRKCQSSLSQSVRMNTQKMYSFGSEKMQGRRTSKKWPLISGRILAFVGLIIQT